MRKYHTDRLCTKYSISLSFLLPDIDECLSGSRACDVTANCTNTDGSHNCTCKEGYTGDGQSCQGIITALDLATMFAMLIQTVTTQRVLIFVLARKDTLEMDSHVKVNKSSPHYLKQAALHRNNCPWKLALLLKTCWHAPLSYFYNHTFCISLMLLDIDECNDGSHDCDVNANCTNTNGSHRCTCKEGYTGKGESCHGKIRLYFKKKQNNCSSQIIALLSNKLAEEFFSLFSYPLRIYCVHRY